MALGRTALLVWMPLGFLFGQEPAPPAPTPPPILENTGKPIKLPFRCTEDDIHLAGLSCTEDEPCPVFLELTAAAASGTRVLAVGNIHTESVTLYSVLLESEDAGHTWSEPFERIRAAALDHVFFRDTEKALATGEEMSPLPQNPFLLLTTDGGKTWRRRPLLDDASEGRFGSIQQLSFASSGTGSLVLDRGQGGDAGRYVLYESPDGGENWLIRQESAKPIALKTPVTAGTDVRIRVDGATKSFHIERRQGDKWTLVAPFLVKLEACKPPEPPKNQLLPLGH